MKANLIRNGCGGEFESPASSTQVLRSLPLSSKGSSPAGSDVIQLTPQEVTVTLRPGECPGVGQFRMVGREAWQGRAMGGMAETPGREGQRLWDNKSIFAILKIVKYT